MRFIDRIQPAPRDGGFALDDYWVWCGSAIRGEDGRYHLFASRWSRNLPFFNGYKVASHIVRAVADRPQGPYTFAEVVLPPRGAEHWDGRMTHNPTIHRCGDTYLLFYLGSTYDGDTPDAAQLHVRDNPQYLQSARNYCIGVATAPSVLGPWTRHDEPALRPRPGKWDASVVTNPAPCVLPDGRILLIYRSNVPGGLRLGAAMAEHFDAPFQRLSDDPILPLPQGHWVEDPYVWRDGDRYRMIAKDWTGITGEMGAGILASSPDGIAWAFDDQPKAYSRTVRWDDGSVAEQGHLERPQLLIEDGRPTHLFLATGDGPPHFDAMVQSAMSKTWTMVIPLA